MIDQLFDNGLRAGQTMCLSLGIDDAKLGHLCSNRQEGNLPDEVKVQVTIEGKYYRGYVGYHSISRKSFLGGEVVISPIHLHISFLALVHSTSSARNNRTDGG